jgi:hypothetical protein
MEQRRFRELADHSRWGALPEEAAADFVNGVAIQNSIRDAGAGEIANVGGHVMPL